MLSDYKKFKDIKFGDRDSAARAQTELLQEHLSYASRHSPFYQKALENIDWWKATSESLEVLPFTSKEDIERSPSAFLAVPPGKVADIVLSSGTMGEPVQIQYTDRDLERLAYNEEQAFAGAGIGEDDIALLTCTMDRCFVAGLAYFLGLRARGATVIRNGHGVIDSHMHIITGMRPTVLVGVPTFLHKLAAAMESKRVSPAESSVKKIICIGEPLRGREFEPLGLAESLEKKWNASVFSTYASSETVTTFCECVAQRGGHLLPELAVIEIVDDRERVLPAGAVGEVVITPLSVEGMPLIRYKTGDVSFLDEKPCSCGRTSPRLGPILGRKKQLMKIKGTSLYPQAVFALLDNLPYVQNYYVEVRSEQELSDILTVHLSLRSDASVTDIEEAMIAHLRVKAEIVIEEDENLKKKIFLPQSRKPVRFFDRRKSYAANQ